MVEVSGCEKKFEMVEVEVSGWCWSSKSSFDFEVGSWSWKLNFNVEGDVLFWD